MRNAFFALLSVVGAGLLIVWLKFGTVDPCGILRAEIRQEAAREGRLAIVALAMPDSVIDAMIAAQYGPLSPGRCIAIAFSGAPLQAPTPPPSHVVTVKFAIADGAPMVNAEVRVFAPGDPNRPVETGRIDATGKFLFKADRDGIWSAEAHAGSEIARVTVRVGGESRPSSR